jgi:hypothetical protein
MYLQVDLNGHLAALLIGDELDSAHGFIVAQTGDESTGTGRVASAAWRAPKMVLYGMSPGLRGVRACRMLALVFCAATAALAGPAVEFDWGALPNVHLHIVILAARLAPQPHSHLQRLFPLPATCFPSNACHRRSQFPHSPSPQTHAKVKVGQVPDLPTPAQNGAFTPLSANRPCIFNMLESTVGQIHPTPGWA